MKCMILYTLCKNCTKTLKKINVQRRWFKVATKNKVGVRIAGKDYMLVGEEPEQYILNLSYYVDKRINEMLKMNPMLSTSMAAVLTSVNFADEYLKMADKQGLILEDYSQATKDLDIANAKLKDLKDEIDKSNKQIELLTKQNDNYEIELQRKEQELEELKTSLERSSKVRFYTKGS